MDEEQRPGTQEGHVFQNGQPWQYLLFLPGDYGQEPGVNWPLIYFLHGAGECGDDLDLLRGFGPAKAAEEQPDFPFICLTPQCPVGEVWNGQIDLLKSLLDQVLSTYAVDWDRVYLTGYSMGGFGAWALAAAYPGTFAALAPICGGGSVDQAERIKEIPVWAFHGAEDPFVPLSESQRMVDALRTAGGQARLTIYPGVGHDSWSESYDNPQLYRWFLSHRRGEAGNRR